MWRWGARWGGACWAEMDASRGVSPRESTVIKGSLMVAVVWAAFWIWTRAASPTTWLRDCGAQRLGWGLVPLSLGPAGESRLVSTLQEWPSTRVGGSAWLSRNLKKKEKVWNFPIFKILMANLVSLKKKKNTVRNNQNICGLQLARDPSGHPLARYWGLAAVCAVGEGALLLFSSDLIPAEIACVLPDWLGWQREPRSRR